MDTNKLEDTVNQILQGAIEKASQGAEFLKEQIPDVVQQLLTWHLVADIVTVIFFGIWIPVYLIISIKGVKAAIKDDWDNFFPSDASALFTGIGGFASLVTLPHFFISIFDAIQIWVAPKVWLLEYASHLLKK